jgi:S-DNA-T family DNA segregation ATPase FtsK/SpoIIIE
MEVCFSVQAPDGSLHDVAARLGVAATGAGLAQALACQLELPEPGSGRGWALYSHRLEAWLPAGELAARLDLREGDTIAVAVAAATAPDGPSEAPSTEGAGATVPFNRQPRVLRTVGPACHALAAPPGEPRKPRLPLVTALLPLLLGGLMLTFTHSLLTLVFILLSPLLAIGSYAEGRLGGRGDFRRGRREFEGRLLELEAQLRLESAEEVRRRHQEAPHLRRLALAAHRREPWLWERRPQDGDFLGLRVGVGEQPARSRVDLVDGGSPALHLQAAARLEPFTHVGAVPLVLPVAERAAVALAGPRQAVLDLARWLVVQAACLHSPRNLWICAAVPREQSEAWDWLKWLPHCSASARPVEGPVLCTDKAAARDLVERLVELLDARMAEVGPFRGTTARAPYPYVLALLHEDLPLSRSSLTRLLADGPRVGIAVLWLGSAVRDLPNECRAVIEVDPDANVTLTYPEDGSIRRGDGRADRAGADEAPQVALELAPLRDAGAADAGGQLPRQVGLVEMLGFPASPGGEQVAARWESGVGGLRVPIGATADGVFEVDLRADGPHALVAGTTGAGKSELLRSLVVALASSHPPSRLNLLLVDYKGGAAFQDAVRLPHTVGLVTDLDDHLARRALVSLRAELRRREEVLRRSSAPDLAELERLGGGDCPPSLVIVVDEFATLVREVPEFVDGVVDLAQRGRSLGLHLVLATQRPAGVVSDSIRANTNLRIALRMSDEAESADVIGVPNAAHVSRTQPGRAFARTGHQELTEFQAAYSGKDRVGSAPSSELTVVPMGLTGPAWPAPTAALEHRGNSDLHDLVLAIGAAHASSGGGEAPRPWLPQLPALLPAPARPRSAGPLAVALGMVDLPQRQRQHPWVLDLAADGTLLVFGTGGSGKTSLLRLLAHALATANEPAALHLYAVDCAGGGLAALQALPNCGAYVRADETERLARLVQWLRQQVDSRRAGAADAMSASRGPGKAAAIVVLLDSYRGFVSAIEKIDLGEHVDALSRLVADGPAVGIHFVLTADRRGEVPAAISSLVPSRLVLRLADEDEYRNAGVPGDAYRGTTLPPGRGFLDDGVEVQCAVLGADGTAESQLLALRDSDATLGRSAARVEVPGVRLLPGRVDVSELPPASRPLAAVVGLADAGLGPAELDLAEDGQLVIGPPHSGRSTALGVAASSLHRGDQSPHLVLLAPRRTPLGALAIWDEVATGMEECARVAAALAARLGGPSADGCLTVVVIDDGEEIAEGPAGGALEIVARRGRDRGVRLLAAVETRAAHRAYAGWVAELRKSRQGILLQPDVDIDGDLLSTRLPRRSGRAFPPGRAYLVHRGSAHLVQLAIPAGSVHQGDHAVVTSEKPHQGMALPLRTGA